MADGWLLISASPGEHRLARLRGNRLVAYMVERPGHPSFVGALFHARVVSVAPGLAGAFLALAPGVDAFLPAEEADPDRPDGSPSRPIGALVHTGQAIAVRVTRAAMDGKGARATARIPPADRARAASLPPPALVEAGPDAIARALATSPEVIVTDDPDLAASIRHRFPALHDRVRTSSTPLFEDALEEEIEALVAPEVRLPRGGRLRISLTPAVTAIDVDTGPTGGGSARAEREAANRAAIAEAARQVALRSLCGPIVLDLAGLPGGRGARSALIAEATKAFAAWASDASVLGFSRLGLLEIVRPRVHPPLPEVLGTAAEGTVLSPLTHALAAFRAALRLARQPGAVPRLVAAPSVIAAARAEAGALATLAVRLGHPLALIEEPSLPPEAWRVEDSRR
jgi:Ribonuclease G/E